jgi:hypothetical protein
MEVIPISILSNRVNGENNVKTINVLRANPISKAIVFHS